MSSPEAYIDLIYGVRTVSSVEIKNINPMLLSSLEVMIRLGTMVGQLDLDGNIWFTNIRDRQVKKTIPETLFKGVNQLGEGFIVEDHQWI